jgi:hypothetical protein
MPSLPLLELGEDALRLRRARIQEERFVKPENAPMVLVRSPEELLAQFDAYLPPAVEKWADQGET